MFTMLSQMIVKTALSEMFRIKEHKNTALEWINGVRKITHIGLRNGVEDKVKNTPKPKECEGIISQIPPKYLDNTMTSFVRDIDPFLLSLIVNGKNMKNCMIDSGASNTVMPMKIMEYLGLKVHNKQGRCCVMDSREVLVIGTINSLPYKLAVDLDANLTITIFLLIYLQHMGCCCQEN